MDRASIWSDKRLQILEFLLAALAKHDEELTAISNHLQEFMQFLSNKRRDFPTETLGTEALGNKIQRLETVSIEHSLAKLSQTRIKTLQALSEERGMTILEVANLTRRSRATENLYLNHLVDLGFVEKVKRGRRYYFSKRITYLNRPVGSVQDPSTVMILTLVSKGVLEEPDKVQSLVLNNLSNLKDWKLERSVILSS